MRRRLKPALTRPQDFDAFWTSTRLQLERIEPCLERRPLPRGRDGDPRAEVVSFDSLGRARISAYFVHGDGDPSRPLVIDSHGYGGRCRPRRDWARAGLDVLSVDIRGFGLSAAALPRSSRWGYVLTGVETPEGSVLRQAVADYMQAARVGRRLRTGPIPRIVFHGISFAGGLALMAQAVLGHTDDRSAEPAAADLLAVGVPTFGWAEGRNLYVRSGSGAEISRYLVHRPDLVEDTMLVMRYFDSINFADWVRCPALVGLGLEDRVVPAKTVYSIVNHLAGPHELMEFPVSHSDHPDERLWDQFEDRFLELALHGLPEDFGA